MLQIWMLCALVMLLCLLMSLRNELHNQAPEQTAAILLDLAAYWQYMQSYSVNLILQLILLAKVQWNFSSQSGSVSNRYRLANERLFTTIEKMTLLSLIAAGFMQSLLFPADTSLLMTATLFCFYLKRSHS